jgi:hypothetical protein
MLRRGSAFNGYSIEATDGKVGTVSDLLFDDTTWQLRWLVVDTGTWLSERKILIHPSSLDQVDIAGRAFPANLTKQQVEASPSIARDEPVSRQMDYDLHGYYGWQEGSFASGGMTVSQIRPMPYVPSPAETATNGQTDKAKADPHLRSIAEVSSYLIHAIDGDIGHLETFLIDDESWTIRFLVVDTANWWMGKHVLVAPVAVKEINWRERFVRLDLTCYKIKGSPAWDNTGIVDRAYEQMLRLYYGWSDIGGDSRRAAEASAVPKVAAQVEARPAKVPV